MTNFHHSVQKGGGGCSQKGKKSFFDKIFRPKAGGGLQPFKSACLSICLSVPFVLLVRVPHAFCGILFTILRKCLIFYSYKKVERTSEDMTLLGNVLKVHWNDAVDIHFIVQILAPPRGTSIRILGRSRPWPLSSWHKMKSIRFFLQLSTYDM